MSISSTVALALQHLSFDANRMAGRPHVSAFTLGVNMFIPAYCHMAQDPGK